ncbi:MAG: right-handed parallel beta-helix repeat-containing protein [Chitinophagales bacterium]|nr:right-handed parallel beta-helix repeat-containing protein [Chitinophagales bacterium]
MKKMLFILQIICVQLLFATYPIKDVQWTSFAHSSTFPASVKKVSIITFGAKADNTTDNSIAIKNAIQSFNGNYGIIEIPAGKYLFKKSISIPSNIILRGAGSDKTILEFNLNGNSDLISVQGTTTPISTAITTNTTKNSSTIKVASSDKFAVGDFVVVKQNATHVLTSNWAYPYFIQILKIKKINGNEISFDANLNYVYSTNNAPTVQKINPAQQVGIEALKIKRTDATSQQTSSIFFNYAVNCYVKGVEMENSNYAHITLQSTANTTISGNYLHDAFDYGSGGKGYGIVLQFGANNNFIYDNIAKHLRHSFLLQAAANGNVIAYNYSYDPYWEQGWFPSNAAGDIVLHGNYSYANLFEGNIIQNLVIDNSHGINGGDNTFFRNRIENYGVVMNNNSGDNMNFIANEITGSGLLKGLFTLSGNQTAIANNIKGDLESGTVTEQSLINKNYASKIGMPYAVGSWKNDAYIRNTKAVKTIVSTSKAEVSTSNTSISTATKSTEVKKKKCTKKRCKRKHKK